MRIFTSCADDLAAMGKEPVAAIDQLKRIGFSTMPKPGTYRSKVLDVVNDRKRWLEASEIAYLSQLTYKQAVDVLQALHNEHLVLRNGRKFTAQWGSLTLAQPAPDGAKLLEDVFRGFFKPKAKA